MTTKAMVAMPDKVVTVLSAASLADAMGCGKAEAERLWLLCDARTDTLCFVLPDADLSGLDKDSANLNSSLLRSVVLTTVEDTARNFCYCTGPNCEGLSCDELTRAIDNGIVTVDDIVATFRAGLREWGGFGP
jgi:hypothetical protein